MYKVRIVLIEEESGEELEFTERPFGDKEKAEAAYSDSAADMLCMD